MTLPTHSDEPPQPSQPMPSAQPHGPGTPDQDELRAALLARMAAAGMSLDDLAAAGLTAAAAVTYSATLADHVARGLDRLKRDHPGTHRTWSPYLRMLADGLPDLCPCACPVCSAGPCPCAEEDHPASCIPDREEGLACNLRYPGRGAAVPGDITVDDVADLAWWAQRKAMKRTVVRNLKREAAGQPRHLTDGRGAAESAIAGARWLFNWLIDNDHASRNPALKVKLPARQERPARSLDAGELLQVYRVAVTTGRDPQLDGLILRHQLIHAVRRGGLLEATCGGLNPAAVTVTYYDRKRNTYRTRPSTPRHLACLLAHVVERGPRVPAPGRTRTASSPTTTSASPRRMGPCSATAAASWLTRRG